MRQVIQSLREGAVEVLDVPTPALKPNHVLIQTRRSVISTGTERMLTEFARSSWLSRAVSQPDRVRQVVHKATTDGLPATIKAVTRRLDEPIALGYANAGIVVAVGDGVDHVKVGDRVASTGPHAEFVCVPKLLVHVIPDTVSFDEACFAPLAAIALHAFRLAQTQIGERVAVIGLGVLGRLTVQIAQAAGCDVVGFEVDQSRAARAEKAGIQVSTIADDSFDVAIVATSSGTSEPLDLAVESCRRGGKIVLLGTADVSFDRAPLFSKELEFQVSRSLGPGRFDPQYEVHGQDFSPDAVRWTEGRNIESVLRLIEQGKISTRGFDALEIPQSDAATAYNALISDNSPLTVVLSYPEDTRIKQTIELPPAIRSFSRTSGAGVTVVGAGAFANAALLPALSHAAATPKFIVSQSGLSASLAAAKFGFPCATTDLDRAIESNEVDAVFIATQHDSHAEIATRALLAGKHVYVEKPLAIDLPALEELEATYRALCRGAKRAPILMVGFNRRFSPMTVWLRDSIAQYSNRQFVFTVNETELPAEHWLLDRARGGGRFVGTACHYVDLVRHLAQSPVEHFSVVKSDAQNAHIQMAFTNGDIATIVFATCAHKSLAKERLDVSAGGESWVIDNFRVAKKSGAFSRAAVRSREPNKGHAESVTAFLAAISGGTLPIDVDEIFEISRLAIEIESL